MKRILVLSSIYPAPDIRIANNTSVVHYFAREWVKMGYDVRVIHNYPVYLRMLHWIAGFAEKAIASKFNTSVTAVYQNKDVEYEMDGVKVVRMPLFKPFPRTAVPRKSMSKQIEKIAAYCDKENFVPDVITAHNFYPHLEMVNKLKEEYFPKANTCIVVHKQVLKMLDCVIGNLKEEMCKVNIWGYRSLPLKREIEGYTGYVPQKQFMCYSGIPSHFLGRNDYCKIEKPIHKFLYVGSFIRRKHPEKLLLGIKKSQLTDFSMDYVGDGANRHIIERLIADNDWQDKVKLHGYVSREKVPLFISQAQCFIMISEEETFGLVYLEAMSMGCITIASRNEGMEGIIEDGVNGFLCKAGDEEELAHIIDNINDMPLEELQKISENAKQTAMRLTDENVARHYANCLLGN
ncbi:MAG: glycosyltransferase [Bacteroidaceae bacterium]|nr:glycosyltransferase [Bacteroidaceae bacterium]